MGRWASAAAKRRRRARQVSRAACLRDEPVEGGRVGCPSRGHGDPRSGGGRRSARGRRSDRLRARWFRRPAAPLAGRRRDVGRHRHRRGAGGDPAAWALSLHRRDHGRGLHALLPRAHRPRRRAERRLPAPLRARVTACPDRLVRAFRLLPASRADLRSAPAPRDHLRAVRPGQSMGPSRPPLRSPRSRSST